MESSREDNMQCGVRILHNQPYAVHRANRKQLQDELIETLSLPASFQYHLILFQLGFSLLFPCDKGSIEDHAIIAAKVYAREECHYQVIARYVVKQTRFAIIRILYLFEEIYLVICFSEIILDIHIDCIITKQLELIFKRATLLE